MKSIIEAWEILSKHGFGKTFEKLQLISCERGKCIADLKIEQIHTNIANTLHGGLIATLVDHVTSFAILSLQFEKKLEPSMSVSLNISYLNKALIGDTVRIEGDCEKMGKNLAFTRAKLYNKDTLAMIATGDHTKFISTSSVK